MISLQEIKGDGGGKPVSAEDLAAIKAEARNIDSILQFDIWQKRLYAENTRYARWEGQSPDGRKRREYMNTEPLPFEGAMDSQQRTADKIINSRVAEYVTAADRMNVRTGGMESSDAAAAGKIKTLIQWLVRNQWGAEWMRQVELAAQYQEGDSPGAAIMWVDWVQERALELKEITPADLAAIVAEMVQGQLTPEMQAEIVDVATNPARAEELQGVLAGVFPDLKPKRIKDVVEQLQTTGRAQFPAPYTRINMPVLAAMRVYEDVFFRPNITDLQTSRIIFRREWLPRAVILERAATQGWDQGFVTDVIGDSENNPGAEQKSMFQDYSRYLLTRATKFQMVEPRKGLYEIVTCLEKLCNDDGVPGVYVTIVSTASEKTAKGREIFNRKHGKYPCVWFSTESITSVLLDARGVPELAGTLQSEKKMYRDSFSDHTQKSTNPPLLKPAGSARYDLLMVPFGEIDAGPRDRFEYLKGPEYPKAAEAMMTTVDLDVCEYFGLPHEKIDPNHTLMLRQRRVNRFLMSLSEVLYMAVELMQQFMTPADLQRVVGGAGMQVPKTIEEIQGKFDVMLYVDVRDWDAEFLKMKGDFLLNYVKRLDPHNIVDTDPVAANLLAAIDPNMAEMAVRPANAANAAEIKAATDAFIKCLNGVRPEMSEGGINAPLRLQVFQGLVQQRQANPAAYPPLAPAGAALIQEYMKYLAFQAQQMQNADIGRLGVDTSKTDAEIAGGNAPPAAAVPPVGSGPGPGPTPGPAPVPAPAPMAGGAA